MADPIDNHSKKITSAKSAGVRPARARSRATTDDGGVDRTDEDQEESGRAEGDEDVIDAEVVDDSREDSDRDEGDFLDPQIEAEIDPSDDEDVGSFQLPIAARPARAAEAGAISTLDPLAAYMRDVQRYPLLTPEETKELSVKYLEEGDLESARKLVTANLRLVVKIAYDYRRAYRNILDLVQEGNIGLMQAVKKYDPYRGVKLSTYAAWWIRAYILRFILNNWRLVKLGTTQNQRKLFFNLKKEKARLSALGIDPTSDLVAKNLDVPEDEVIQMERRLSGGEMSLDAPIGNAEGKPTPRIELLAGDEANADDSLADAQIQDLLTDKIREYGRTLVGKEAIIFAERLMSDEPKTLQELGDVFGVSRERVRQLEKRLQNRIRAYLEAEVDPSALPNHDRDANEDEA